MLPACLHGGAVWINAKIELVAAFKTSAGNAGGTKPSVRVGGWRELAQSLDPSVEARVCLTRIQAREPSVVLRGWSPNAATHRTYCEGQLTQSRFGL
jgi:hypothetical protein